jgi:hypothetical protein
MVERTHDPLYFQQRSARIIGQVLESELRRLVE